MKCEFCGKEFQKRAATQKYCSCTCQRKAEYLREHREKKPKIAKCAFCGIEFLSYNGRKYCSEKCRQKKYYSQKNNPQKKIRTTHCLYCGVPLPHNIKSTHRKFCCALHGEKYRRGERLTPTKAGKSLAEWEREAAECNLDYGNYRALLNVGKTYEELKALADGRGIRYHSCGYPKNTRSPQESYGRFFHG